MTNNENPQESAISGSVQVKTKMGKTMSIFVLSAEDFLELKPREDDYVRVAAMINSQPSESKPSLVIHDEIYVKREGKKAMHNKHPLKRLFSK